MHSVYSTFMLEGEGIMRKISFRVRNFEKEQFLTFNISNDAKLDEELLNFLEEEEPKGIVPVIFEEEDEFDTFSYNVTDKIHLIELSNQEINAEMVLLVMRSLVLTLIDMAEYRIPLSYLVLNRNYIYVDSDYRIEFICIPLEDMQEDVNLSSFLRNFLASLRFEPSENGDYVAKLFTYINNPALFNLRNMVNVIDELMQTMNVAVPEDGSTEIYADYQELEETASTQESTPDLDNDKEADEDTSKETFFGDAGWDMVSDEDGFEQEPSLNMEEAATNAKAPGEDKMTEETKIEEDNPVEETLFALKEAEVNEQTDSVAEDLEPLEKPVEDKLEDALEEESLFEEGMNLEQVKESDSKEKENKKQKEKNKESDKKKDSGARKASNKEKESQVSGVVIQDDLDEFLAEKELEEQKAPHEESDLHFKKNIKISRANIVKNTREEEQKETEERQEKKEEAELADKGKNQKSGSVKVNPYLIRVNTDDMMMITKSNFKIGTAGLGVDFTVHGNKAVSRVHAVIVNKDGEYFIKDNKSTNHTYVNGEEVREGELKPLKPDSKIVLGDEEFIFKV